MSKVSQRGRPKIPTHLKKETITIRLPVWLLEHMRRQPISQGEYIEKALVETYGLSPSTRY